MINTVLFDMGGTLEDISIKKENWVGFADYLLRVLRKHGIELDTSAETLSESIHQNAEEYKHWSEQSKVELEQARIWNEYYLKDYHLGESILAPISEELSFIYDYVRCDAKAKPYLKEMLQELSGMGIHLGVISNVISTSYTRHMLRQYGILDFMECVVLSSEAGCRKPDARIFEVAMRQIGSTAETTCYVGDMVSRDVIGSRNANLAMSIQISNPARAWRDAELIRQGAPEPDYLIQQLNEIPKIIRDYNKKN